MNRLRPLILAVVIAASALLAYGLFTQPFPAEPDADGFSAGRVAEDIKVISSAPHSVADPEERAAVRDYLIERLEGLGADDVKVFRYDSLVGPQNKHVVYDFDAYDVLAEFPPLKPLDDTTCLMMVAHYDSKFSQPMPKDTVWSLGAADDGYGLGVILETVGQLLGSRQEWNKGVKVLFTDAEEVDMSGMKAIWENDREVFDNVGLVINLEARGPWGPVLLFETSPGNEKIIDLYASAARHPYTYSLTTVVYGMMPSFTDFNIVRDHIPGMNFSTVADINHYHTDLDNFNNISEKTIQHYGEQVLPVAMEYVCGDYQGPDALKAERDLVNFTIPGLGLFKFSKTAYLILNIVLAVLFSLLFAFEVIRGRLVASKAFKLSGIVFCVSIGILAMGELVGYLSALAAGAEFKPFGIVQGVPFDNVVMIIVTVIMAVLTTVIYVAIRNRNIRMTAASMRHSAAVAAAARHAYRVLYGALALICFLSLVLVFALGENMMFIIPLFFSVTAVILWHFTSMKVWLVVAIGMILLHAFSFLYVLVMALTIGAFGAVAMLAFIDMMVLIPLADLYLTERRK